MMHDGLKTAQKALKLAHEWESKARSEVLEWQVESERVVWYPKNNREGIGIAVKKKDVLAVTRDWCLLA